MLLRKIFYLGYIFLIYSNAYSCDFFELNSGGWKIECSKNESGQVRKNLVKEDRKSQWVKDQWRRDLIKNLKANAKKLENEFKTDLVFPISIFILPANHFNDANAYFNKGRIFIKSSKVNSKTLLHEMIHLVLYRISDKQIPEWLDEGLATYLTNDSKVIYSKADQGKCNLSLEECRKKKFYYNSLTKVKKIIQDIGIKKLVEVIKKQDMSFFNKYRKELS